MMNTLELMQYALPLLLKGAVVTLQVTLCGFAIGFTGGMVIGTLLSRNCYVPVLSPLLKAYSTILRGFPVYVQLLIIYFALPSVLGINLSPLIAGILTIGINSTAYVAEIMRGGINALPAGQWEAGTALGYNKTQTVRYIIVPQAFTHVLPSLINEASSLVKETSVLGIIGTAEVTKMGKEIVVQSMQPMTVYCMIALFYLICTSLISLAGHIAEKRNET